MNNSARRTVAIAALAAAFGFTGATAAFASDLTLEVPGTVVTKPCTATLSTNINTNSIPPASATSTTSCKI